MKKQKKDTKKGKAFLNMPSYAGSKESLEKFIKENLRYPDEARLKGIEGIVHVSFDVDHNGDVSREKIIRSVGYGCDEEALRIIGLLKFNPSFNKGMKVKKNMKFRIPFVLGKQTPGFVYQYVEKAAEETSEETNKKDSDSGGYGYTIKF